jgi:hypothetical protein
MSLNDANGGLNRSLMLRNSIFRRRRATIWILCVPPRCHVCLCIIIRVMKKVESAAGAAVALACLPLFCFPFSGSTCTMTTHLRPCLARFESKQSVVVIKEGTVLLEKSKHSALRRSLACQRYHFVCVSTLRRGLSPLFHVDAFVCT